VVKLRRATRPGMAELNPEIQRRAIIFRPMALLRREKFQ
jgi:hypothetical protein